MSFVAMVHKLDSSAIQALRPATAKHYVAKYCVSKGRPDETSAALIFTSQSSAIKSNQKCHSIKDKQRIFIDSDKS